MNRTNSFARLGWRARIGVITPAVGMAVTSEFHQIAPEGVALALAQVQNPLIEDTVETLTAVGNEIADAAKRLKIARATVAAFNSTSASLIKGMGYDQELKARLESVAGIPATTASTAMLNGFRKLGIAKISLVAAYVDEVVQREITFLEAHGIQVVRSEGLSILEVADIIDTPAAKLYQAARKANHPSAEGIYISCAALNALPVIDVLEQDLGKPVLATNQATLWDAFRLAQINEPIQGFGTLLRTR